MPATLVWGKGFHVKNSMLHSGEEYPEVFGIDGDSEPISWSSVGKLEKTAVKYGIDPSLLPIYRECEDELAVPIEDAEVRSDNLRTALEAAQIDQNENDYWLIRIMQILRAGNSFLIMP